MTKRLTFALQKGGVGKSTSTVITAEILAAAGYRVLVVDFDSQGNATKILTGNSIYQYTGKTVMEAVKAGKAKPYIVEVKPNLDLLPAEDRLAAFSRYIYTSRIDNPYGVLKRLLAPIEQRYDYVFVDIGPTLGDTLINAIVYADYVITPVDMGDLAMDALVRFMEFIEATRDEGHTNAEVLGILMTMKEGRIRRYEKGISDGLREVYGGLVFQTEIRRRIAIKEIAAEGVTMIDPVIEDYVALVEEITERIKRKENNHE